VRRFSDITLLVSSGKVRQEQALMVLKNYANKSTLVISYNNKLREVYGILVSKQDFQKADEVLATASRERNPEVITHTQNIDLRDAKTVFIIAERLLWDHLFLLVKIEPRKLSLLL
jgi:cell division GTPase FtsZ